MTEEGNLQEAKTKVREAFDEVAAAIVDGQRSLTARMVRAHRAGAITGETAVYIWSELAKVCKDAEITYNAAIAQPAPRVSLKSRITL